MVCTVFTTANAQTVTKNFHKETLKKVLKEVEQQTRMSFIYNSDLLNEKKRITANFKHTDIHTVLDRILDDDIDYIIEKKLIVLYRKEKTADAKVTPPDRKNADLQEKHYLRGIVTDADKEPLAGAYVSCKKLNVQTHTDSKGYFMLEIPRDNIIEVSYIGFHTREIFTGKKSYLRITLEENIQNLDETIVIAYGSTTRQSITGAVDKVSNKLAGKVPYNDVTQALQGKAPGLIIQQKDFNPNTSYTNVNIRGISTINSNMPLIVIDGIVSPDNSLDKINPNDVDNVSILKDAGAAAIYGSRSANGVILITTKKGRKNERMTVRLDAMTGWQIPHILYRPISGYLNAQARNEMLRNVGLPAEYVSNQLSDLYNNRHKDNWFLDRIFRTAMQNNHNISVTGGSDKTTYMVSAGYIGQESNYVGNKNYGMRKYNLRSNVTTEAGPLKLQALIVLSQLNKISTTGTSLERDASRVPPYYYYQMKADNRYLLNNILTEFNPLGSLEAGGTNKDRENDFSANITAEIKITPKLSLKGVFGTTVNSSHNYMRQRPVPYYTSLSQSTPARYDRATRKSSDTNSNSYMINSQLLMNYDHTKGNHHISGMLGISNESSTRNSNKMTVMYSNPDFGTSQDDNAYVVLGDDARLSPEDFTRTGISSIFGRAAYNYAGKYYGEMDFRYDGSSKFARNHRFGFFPSVSAGWRITEESFMESFKEHVGTLKLRCSYGILGNQTIGAYDRFTTFNLYNYMYAFNNSPVTGAGFTLGSDDLTWEKTHTVNMGLDVELFKHTLSLTFDCFYKRTKDILMRPVTPSIFGTQQSMQNTGEMSNRGWELALKYTLTAGKTQHIFTANIGDTYNRLEKFPEGEKISPIEELWILRKTGVPVSSYYGYRTDGFFQSEEEIARSALPVGVRVQPGDLKFVDRNDDNIIDANDRFVLGNAFPRYTFGFSYSMKWKNIDFNLLVNGVGKRDMMVRGELVEPFFGNYSYTMYKHQQDYWRPDHTNAIYPRLTAPGSESNSNNYRMGSDIYIFNAAYIRLKDISIGYTLPERWTMKVGIRKVRLSINAKNLLTLSHNSFLDPESTEFDGQMMYNGANTGCNYPTLKYIGMGLNVEI